MNTQKVKTISRKGFTIVELLVVITIIGILATISIISYGAWRHSAIAAKVKSDLNGVASAMESALTFNNVYPSTVPSSIVPSSGVTLKGGSTDGTTYCVEADSTEDPTITYYLSSATVSAGPQAGTCASVTTTPLPAAPTGLALTSSTYNSFNASWTAVTGATGYTLQCATDTAFVNNVSQTQTTALTVTLSSLLQNTSYYCRVESSNSGGNSAWSNSVSINTQPIWTSLSFQNGWTNYGNTFATGGYTLTSAGMVVLKGLVQNPATTTTSNWIIATLPVGYRPSEQLIFQTTTNSNVASRVDVDPNGNIYAYYASNVWLSLDGINFLPSTSPYTFSPLSPLLNGWLTYGSPFASPAYATDNNGRVHVKGLVKGGTITNGTAIATLPVGSRPQYYMHIVDDATGAFGLISLDTSGNVVAKGFPNSYDSIQAMFYPSSYSSGSVCTTSWCSLTLQNGWLQHGTGYTPPSYTKGSDGLVVVNGLIDSGATSPGTVIAKLPVGYRPKDRLIMDCASNMAAGRIDIMPNGDIMIVAGVSSAWLSLDSISFIAEQ